ncbi:MAG TPA: flagellar basal body rod protein FlgB [Firmicutes bacterium]|nr:flagellar basal body rod protein FlgB [Candidatus Fermentithermobacillaceae bacterium]
MAGITTLLERALDGAWARHQVLANNVANSETPGYKRQELDFQTYLARALQPGLRVVTTHPKHMAGVGREPLYVTQDLSSITPDGNSVDIDREMAEVSTNALYYASVSKQLSSYFALLRKAITEGRR